MNYTLPNEVFNIETDSYAEEISLTEAEILAIIADYAAKQEGLQA